MMLFEFAVYHFDIDRCAASYQPGACERHVIGHRCENRRIVVSDVVGLHRHGHHLVPIGMIGYPVGVALESVGLCAIHRGYQTADVAKGVSVGG